LLKDGPMTLTVDPVAIERNAHVLGISEIAGYLQQNLGQQITAYLSGLRDPKMVGRWAAGKVEPRDAAKMRLRTAYQAACMLVDAYGAETAKAWFFGSNTRLDDEAPAFLLRYAEGPDSLRFIVAAARGFAGGED
jgi:hypothetical protein